MEALGGGAVDCERGAPVGFMVGSVKTAKLREGPERDGLHCHGQAGV